MLRRLRLEHFRNYQKLELSLSPGVNAFIGANGQGKTNLLEAVYFLSLLRSFRTTKNNVLCLDGTGGFLIYGEVETASGDTVRLGVRQGAERSLVVNGSPVRKSSDFISRFYCAPFLPEDLSLIKGMPGLRRRFLDIALCQLEPGYLRICQQFHEAVRSRNAMLRTPDRYPREVITAFDPLLVETGAQMECRRRALGEALDQALREASAEFFPDGRLLACSYLSGVGRLMEKPPESVEEIQELYAKSLQESFERDLREGCTRHGPQRGDLACLLQKRNLTSFGSEGECRTAALALRLAMMELLRKKHGGESLTILVDDVLGELDATRRRAFLQRIADAGQILFAGTALPPEFPRGKTALFHVDRGEVQPG